MIFSHNNRMIKQWNDRTTVPSYIVIDVWIVGFHQKSDVSDVNNCAYIPATKGHAESRSNTHQESVL